MSTSAPLPARIGAYPVERELGRGGMGIVYLGRDTRLDRPVAIKVLPSEFTHDPERLARFEREARLLAALMHPNVAGIHGLEEADGQRFLVLEYVEGETLAERIARGPLPLDEAVDFARQIAAALEAAHESGIIHRDLKPGNVKITPSGDVKVLDFGLAKGGVGAGAASDAALSVSPTVGPSAMTAVGVILGTAAYMSPEQARGRSVDRRTDIWSFGCVLYECLTGQQAFDGETISDIIASILQGAPDWAALPASVPPHLRTLIERCLVKDAKKRLRDIGEAKLLLEGDATSLIASSSSATAASGAPAAATRARWAALPWTLAAAGLLGMLALGAVLLMRGAPSEPVLRAAVDTPRMPGPFRDVAFAALSEDGQAIASTSADSAGGAGLWLRWLGEVEGRLLPGTTDGALPFWSPDGRYLAFTTANQLQRLDLRGGNPEALCPVSGFGRGGSWSERGVIVFSAGADGPLFKVAASGGTPEQITTLDSSETGHRFPRFLPDGRHFLFAALPPRLGQFSISVGSTDSPTRERLMVADGTPVYVDPGYLLYSRNGRIVAHRFDASSRKLIGEPLLLADAPKRSEFLGSTSLLAGRRGPLAYFRDMPELMRLAWLDPAGRVEEVLSTPADQYLSATLSPDGKRAVVVKATSSEASDLWILDLSRAVLTQLTTGPGRVDRPVWSPDGSRIVFSSDREGHWGLYEVSSEGGGGVTPIGTGSASLTYPSAYSLDGRTVIYEQLGKTAGWDVWQVALDGDRTPRALLTSKSDEQSATLSPDGRWLAFSLNLTGRPEIHMVDYPGLATRRQITTAGGLFPKWRADGRALLFVAGSGAAMVGMDPATGRTTGAPRSLRTPAEMVAADLTADFTRVLAVMRAPGTDPGDDLTIVSGWRGELMRE